MILPCPACMARFMVPDERITRKGVKIRCPKCRFVFIMKAGTDKKKKRPQPAATEGNVQAATSGAIGEAAGAVESASGAIGETSGAVESASGAIGEAAPAAPKKRKRRAPKEGLAENITQEELAAIEEDEIVDMDDLAQATEQSGLAVKAEPKLEHMLPQGEGGPSVVLDDSILAAAAAYTAAMGDGVVAAHSVSDTLMDFGPREDEITPPARPRSLMVPPPAPTPIDVPEPAAGDLPPPAPTPYDAGVPAEGAEAVTPKQGFRAAQTAAEMAAEADDVDLDVDLDMDEDDDILTGAVADASAPLSMPTTFTMTALAPEYESLSELEGLLVEEKRALQKGPAAKAIAIIGIVLGVIVLSLLGTLIYARLNPPKKKPPSWGNLQLSNLKHDLFERKDLAWIVKVEVRVNNASKRAKYRNVNLKAQILDPEGKPKCENHAPCGLHLSRKDIAAVTRKSYHRALKLKSTSEAYNIQLNPGQGERCQILLFCGKRYKIGADKIKVAIDKERTTRLAE